MTEGRGLAFSVHALTKRFDLTPAVENVSFSVASGTVAGLVGPKGAGKTTILRMLLGLLEPTSGTVAVGASGPRESRTATGARTAEHSAARLIGGLLEPRGLHPARTARDHLMVYAAAAGVDNARVDEVIHLVGLDDAARIKAGLLPTGQQTRLALATALLGDPPLLVLDEPLAGLDHAERGWLQDFLRKHVKRGGAAVVTSESLATVIPMVDNIIVVREGSVVYQGTPAKLRRGHPDRLVVAASTPIALATTLAAQGFTDAVIRPDGRLAIADADETRIRAAATAAGVRLDSITVDQIHPDRVLASLVKPARPAPPAPYPAIAPPHPTPTPYGIPR